MNSFNADLKASFKYVKALFKWIILALCVGLVGGTGPESTLMYYKELNTRIDDATGGKNMPEILIESVNFRKAWNLVSSSQYKELADYLSEKVVSLANSGAEVIALTAGTMHIVFDEIEKNTKVSLISIPKAVCEEVIKKGYKRVGLLGTIFTMEQDFMKKDFLQAGIDVISMLGGLVLVLGHALQFAHVGVAVQDPAKLGMAADVALAVDDVLLGIQAAGHVGGGNLQAALAQLSGILADGDGVHIHHAVDAVVLILQKGKVPQRADIVAQRQGAGGLNAGEHYFLCCCIVVH